MIAWINRYWSLISGYYFSPGLFCGCIETWTSHVGKSTSVTDVSCQLSSTALNGSSNVSFCCCYCSSCSALRGWSPLSSWSSCSQGLLEHQMMWVKWKQQYAPCGDVFSSCEHPFALAWGVHLTFCFWYRLISAVWSNPSSQATKISTQWCTHAQPSLTSSKRRFVTCSHIVNSVHIVWFSVPSSIFFIVYFRLFTGMSKPCCFQ